MNSELISIIFLLSLGFVPLAIGLWHLKRCIGQFSWNETEGVIIQSEIIRPRPPTKSGLMPLIRYEYQVGSQKHISDKLSEDNFTSGMPFAVQSVKNRYPFGKKVRVFYNPDHPEQSVLERRITWGTYLWLAIGIFFLSTISLAIKNGGQ